MVLNTQQTLAYHDDSTSMTRTRGKTVLLNDVEVIHLWHRAEQLEKEVQQLRCALAHERYHACIDPLTQLPNRRAYLNRLQEERRRYQRSHKRLCLIVWDIDHFKSINDQHGHQVGDQVLTSVAQIIKKRLRKTDFTARIGGEEFVSLLPDCDIQSAHQMAEELRKEIAGFCVASVQQKAIVTISCGIAELIQNESNESLFTRADSALYQAKSGGRNRVWLADS